MPRRASFVTLFSIAIIAATLGTLISQQFGYAWSRADNLTEMFDAYSEANGIRAGEGYATNGFTSNAGLPEVSFGTQFDGVGGKYDRELCPDGPVHCVYLHYPQLPDLVIGASTKIFGVGHIGEFRLVPLFLGTFAFIFFAWALVTSIGAPRAAFIIGSFYFIPMSANAMHYLHNHSYQTHFLLIELGVLFLVFHRSGRLLKRYVVALFVIGLLLGYTAFDYFAHVSFGAIVVWMTTANPSEGRRKVIVCTLAAVTGYALANILHFAEVAVYLHGFREALANFVRAGKHRSMDKVPVELVRGPFGVLDYYLFDLLPRSQYCNFSFVGVTAFTVALLSFRAPPSALRSRLTWAPRPTFVWGFGFAVFVPCMWLLIMEQHSRIHGHFLPRNFFFSLIFAAAFVALSVRVPDDERAPVAEPGDEQSAPEESAAAATPPPNG